ncbi:MAG TPA: molecular chaperone Hsp90, partial [Candidatus Eisenbacteria bacterium]|nr:molecular chaperone Hsp90 [Candidatus Eisenbacteria bacterium]
MSGDPFGTAALRARVLDAWTASPARFREDANAEEDLALGGYRDRVVVELAQNAADAAARAGVPGRLLLRLADGVLTASNTGAALDAAGVETLSTLRASAKRGTGTPGTVGRFGVGFAAVLAVSDEPRVVSTSGAARWSLAEARATVAGVPALADELTRRGGQVPALRLPWAADGEPETGFDTTVVLPLRDEPARALAARLLEEVDDALLLALPALAEVVVEVDGRRRSLGDAARWHVVRRSGALDPALLAGRPTEERDRPFWSLTWALPVAGQPVPATLHAPTPTDEPLDLPALLIGSFPLDPSRRHVAPGALTDFLVGQAARAYAELVAASDDPLALVPGVVPAGALDAALRTAIVAALA